MQPSPYLPQYLAIDAQFILSKWINVALLVIWKFHCTQGENTATKEIILEHCRRSFQKESHLPFLIYREVLSNWNHNPGFLIPNPALPTSLYYFFLLTLLCLISSKARVLSLKSKVKDIELKIVEMPRTIYISGKDRK